MLVASHIGTGMIGAGVAFVVLMSAAGYPASNGTGVGLCLILLGILLLLLRIAARKA